MKIIEKAALLILFFSLLIITLGSISLFYLHLLSVPLENEIPETITDLSDSSHLLSHAHLIKYYDEVLTQSARNYAFTQNVMWSERYYESEPKLDQAISGALEHGTEQTNKIFYKINDANNRLVELEHLSLNLVNDNKSEEAIMLLESEEYWNLKQEYSNGLTEFSQLSNAQYFNAVDSSLATLESVTLTVSDQSRSAFEIITMMIFIFLILSISFIYFSLKSTIFSISNLRDAVHKMANKKTDIVIEPSGEDELQDLTRDIKIMYEKLLDDEKELLKNTRLVAIGELSARLAHDLRNPLSVLRTSIENIRFVYGKHTDLTPSFMRMDKAIDRMTHQLDEVMDFVRQKPLTIIETSLFAILDASISIMNIPKSVKITYPKDDLTINCDPDQMQNVFSNIILNGIQAINDNGQIDITTASRRNSSIIVFTDSGPPIPEKVISRVFEPLFTTKQKGTGLGLASCKTIIESHGGTIHVNNNPTSFKIILPRLTKNN